MREFYKAESRTMLTDIISESQVVAVAGSSFKEGETSNWYFLGYVSNGSRTSHLTLWGQK